MPSWGRAVTEPEPQVREQLAAVGLLAAQVAMAAARLRDGLPLDSTDRRVLARMIDLFRSEAKRIRAVSQGGGLPTPRAMLTTGIGDELVLPKASTDDPEEVAAVFDEVAAELEAATATHPSITAQSAADLYERFSGIAERAREWSGSPGHRPPPSTLPTF
jgi:hypothetical protein